MSMPLRGVDIAHRQAHAPLTIHLENFHAYHIAFFQFIADALDALFGDLRDVNEAVAARGTLPGSHLPRALVLDIDRGTGFFGDLPNHGAALADHVADLFRIDLERDYRGGPLRHALTRLGERLVHLGQDVQAAVAGLIQRHLHDLARDAGDLDIHLQRSDAVLRAGHFEIHVAEMILVAQYIRQD